MTSLDPSVKTALEVAQQFVATYEPMPAAALLAGSRAKGTQRRNSDYDVVLLYPDLPDGAWREMVANDGKLFEVFAHDLRSLEYFLREVERPSGEASLACMIDEGLPVFGSEAAIQSRARELARDFLACGPLPLADTGLRHKRYAITDLAEALSCADSKAQRLAIGSALYPALGNFVLLANGRWTAGGKALPAALRSYSPSLERAITSAFMELYLNGMDPLVQGLVNEILEPFGGRLRAGFHQQAPSSWRT